jgi:opacity protein-like surface antigen
MKKVLLFITALFLVSSVSIFSQMKLKLLSDISIIPLNKLEVSEPDTDLNSDLAAELPDDVTKLIPGSFMIGLLADVSFPFGEEFKKYAGTGFSGHVFAGYSILNSLLLTFKVGYIKFGEKEVDLNMLNKITQEGYSFTQTNSQIPILIGGQYMLGLDPSCLGCLTGSLIQPWIGCQFGIFFKNFSQVSNYPFEEINGTLKKSAQFTTDTFEESSTIFGIVPTIGTFYGISENVKLNISIEYSYLFEEADVGASNINFLSINAGAAYTFK